jgi:hypothetical protein
LAAATILQLDGRGDFVPIVARRGLAISLGFLPSLSSSDERRQIRVTLSPERLRRWYRDGMRRAGLIILYVVAIAIGLGGVGDLTIRALFDVHKRFLGTADVPATTTALVLHLLHALGGGLVGIGLASLALVHFGVRRGAGWALWAMLAAVIASEGANAVGMYAVGSFWYVSVTFIVLTAIGVTLVAVAAEPRPHNG